VLEDSSVSLIRCLHGATTIPDIAPPYNTVHFRIFYPAHYTGTDAERLTGSLPPDLTDAPWPVVVILPGINVGSEGYRWIAERLAANGIAAVTYSFVTEVMAGNVGLSPGLDLSAVRPQTYGTRPSCTVLTPLLDALKAMSGAVVAQLDLTRILTFGHSAGGTVALENARPDWFPGLLGVIGFGAHTVPSLIIGHPEGTVLGIGPVPTLLIEGEFDGVIARSQDRYGTALAEGHHPVVRTFREGVSDPTGASVRVVVRNATHLSILDPVDSTTARGFLEPPEIEPDGTREVLGELIVSFSAAVLRSASPLDSPRRIAFDGLARHPLVFEWETQTLPS
jgi:dienelactone hydrolase